MLEYQILFHNPDATPYNVLEDKYNTLPMLICTNALAAIFMDGMTKPKWGTLILHQDNIWYFHIRKVNKYHHITLPILHQYIFHLVHISQLTHVYPLFHTVFNAHQ